MLPTDFKCDLTNLLLVHQIPQTYGVEAFILTNYLVSRLDEYIKSSVVKDWSLPIPKQVD